ncbi:MAG: F0F1 ATP synthase subunit A [Candidatus Saccharimonadales bacterium]
MNTLYTFASSNLHISLSAEPIFHIGSFAITNAMLLGFLGTIVTLVIFFYVGSKLKKGSTNRFVGLVQWAFEGMLKSVDDVITDRKLARTIAPTAITIFFFVLINYWLGILPGIGSITWNGLPLFRSLTADLNFTFAIAIITMVGVQIYAIKHHGVFGNAGRYFKNPLKDPIGAFEGVLEFIGEFSRGVSLSLRLFGNAFAGEVLLLIVGILTSYFATVTLPIFMAFELFIGFIQAYVFFILTLIFTSLAQESHAGDPSSDHSPAASAKKATQLE